MRIKVIPVYGCFILGSLAVGRASRSLSRADGAHLPVEVTMSWAYSHGELQGSEGQPRFKISEA